MPEDELRAQAFAKALRALGAGATDEAAQIASALARRRPDDPAARQLMAAVALAKSDPVEAERWALASLAVRPDHSATLILAARAARARGDLPAAFERFARARELNPDRSEAAFGVAAILIQQNAPEAPRSVSDLQRLFPDHGPGWSEIGAQSEQAGKWELAADAYARAANSRPSAKLHLRLGSALQSLGRRSEAVASYRKALELDPASAETWFKLGLALQDGRRPADAALAYRRALSLRPELAEAEANLGVALQELGDLAAAKEAYCRAIRLKPEAFGRIAQALTMAPTGELWMDLAALRAHLSEPGRLSR